MINRFLSGKRKTFDDSLFLKDHFVPKKKIKDLQLHQTSDFRLGVATGLPPSGFAGTDPNPKPDSSNPTRTRNQYRAQNHPRLQPRRGPETRRGNPKPGSVTAAGRGEAGKRGGRGGAGERGGAERGGWGRAGKAGTGAGWAGFRVTPTGEKTDLNLNPTRPDPIASWGFFTRTRPRRV